MKQCLIVPILSLIIFSSCEKKEVTEKQEKFTLSDTMLRMIRLDTVRLCNMNSQLTLSGQVSFNENNVIKIPPRGSGQVIECKASLGDKVNKGQVLAVIRSADVAGNYSDLNSANADLAIAKRQMDNTESLYKNGIASERELTEAKENYQKMLAAKGKILSAISINGGSKSSANGQYVLTSPIDGYIVEKKINTGDFIRSDYGDNLFTISDLKTVWIYANVYETDIPKIKEGYNVEVSPVAYSDKVLHGKVDKISQILDPESKAMKVRVVLNNSDMLLKPEMFAQVVVTNEEGTKALCIPTSSIVSQDGKNYVVIYSSKDKLKISEVNIIRTVNDQTFVSDGVVPGQRLITKNQLFIFNQLVNE